MGRAGLAGGRAGRVSPHPLGCDCAVTGLVESVSTCGIWTTCLGQGAEDSGPGAGKRLQEGREQAGNPKNQPNQMAGSRAAGVVAQLCPTGRVSALASQAPAARAAWRAASPRSCQCENRGPARRCLVGAGKLQPPTSWVWTSQLFPPSGVHAPLLWSFSVCLARKHPAFLGR